jgi:hypothetical protein
MKLKLAIILFAALVGPAVRFGAGLFAEKQPAQVAASVHNAYAGNVMAYRIVSLPKVCDYSRSAVTAPLTSATSAQAVVGTGALPALSLADASTACTGSQIATSAVLVRSAGQ